MENITYFKFLPLLKIKFPLDQNCPKLKDFSRVIVNFEVF